LISLRSLFALSPTMAPKLPGKFDDISKAASGVLGDDFQCDGFQVKAKQTTNFDGATYDLTVDYAAKEAVKTPAKLSFKFPKPLAKLEGLAVDKLDLDKNGGIKLESSLSKALHGVDGLKLEVKPDFVEWKLKALTYSSTFTGHKDLSLKFETSHFEPTKFTLEALHGIGPCVLGAQLKGMASLFPSVGVNYQEGDFFASIIAKEQFSEITAHGLYTASKDIKLAATYQYGGKKSGAYCVGGSLALGKDLAAKAKFDGDKVSVALKKDLAKGSKLFCGFAYEMSKGDFNYGAKLSIE